MIHRHEHSDAAFGFWIYLMSDVILFAALFATYAVQHTAIFGGLSGSQLFDLNFVLTETLVLLTSSFTIGLAVLAANSNKKLLTILALLATLALGATFLKLEISEFIKFIGNGDGPGRSAFLSSFFTLVGTHGLHVFLGSLWMLVIIAHVYYRGLVEATKRKILYLSLFWHFLDVVWIFIFTLVYLMGVY